ncbi:hypothetical protein DL98DRAFT_519919 [Cadophora sp. DSE1049]|nr:hypothetical protein DL98DRAFT_519919 [Cadophora sp. DSE1049]
MASQSTSSSKASGNAAVDVRPISSSKDFSNAAVDSQPTSASKDSGNIATDSATGEDLVKDHIIYPFDGHNIDSISSLLASYPPSANIIPHISVSGWGMMYWEATISPAQAQEISLNKQVHEVHAKLSPDEIEDPDD